MKAEEIWMPTLYLMNAASENIKYRPGDLDLAYLYNNGLIEGWLFTNFRAGCSLDLRKYLLN